jgi:beta-galactosidase
MQEYKKRYPVVVNPIYKHPLEKRIDLGGEWSFRLDPEDIGIKEKWYENLYFTPEKIQVPGCWQGQDYGNSDKDFVKNYRYDVRVFKSTYKGTGWYSKVFTMPRKWKGLKVWLNFGGVNPTAEVWVNREKIGNNRLPFVSFGFDITDCILFDDENIVVIRVSEQDRLMSLCYNWSGNWSGLYRTVELTAYNQIGIDEVRLYPSPETGEIKIKTKTICEPPDSNTIKCRIKALDIENPKNRFEEVFVLNDNNFDGEHFNFNMKVNNHKNWSPGSPNLYRIDFEISYNNKICDAISHRTGFVRLKTEDKHIQINGIPHYMKGTGDFYESPDTGSPDLDIEVWKKKLRTLRSYGYNYVRCQSYVPTPEYFDAADEVGLIVQSEMGVLGGLGGHSIWHTYQWPQPTPDMCGLLIDQWNSIVVRDINHPSANMYCMSNEMIGDIRKTEYPRIAWETYNYTKTIKPHSLVIWTDGGYKEDLPGDLVIHTASTDKKTEKPVIQHEYNCWSSFPDIRLAPKFNGATRPYGIEIAYKSALKHKISHILLEAAMASQRLQFVEAKIGMERLRADYPNLAGICHFNAMDINASPQGILDIFYEKKYIDNNVWLQTNGDTVILSSLAFNDRIYSSGDIFSCKLFVSDYSKPHYINPIINWKIVVNNKIIKQGRIKYEHKPYVTCLAGEINIALPKVEKIACSYLEAELLEGDISITNKWNLWVLPKDREVNLKGVCLCKNGIVSWLDTLSEKLCPYSIDNSSTTDIIVTDRLTEDILNFVKCGGRIFLAAGEGLIRPFQYKSDFSGGGRYYISNRACTDPYEFGQHGTIIKNHPIFGDFPHEQFADLHFYNMLAESPPIDLEAFGLNDIDPIMRMIHNYQVGRSLGQLLERRVGDGLIVICSLNLDQKMTEAVYLFANICEYICSADIKEVKEMTQKSIEDIIFAGTIIDA